MPDASHAPMEIGPVTVQLLDPSSGRPMQTWTFQGQGQITIGRSPDQDVAISDPYVSRQHASLVIRDGQWLLVSKGRNGIIVANQLVMEHLVSDDVSFRLGSDGPTLRFRVAPERDETMATISFDTLPIPLFELDERKLQDEVGEISGGDYFQSLQARAKQLRRKRERD